MSVAQAKGLLNMPGQNNCFLNSAVQVLWHLDIFRRSFRELSGHACMGCESCIFCALKELFTQFQYSHESALPPDSLRKALAETFSDQRRFQLGFMDDAAECFENILLRIHGHITIDEAEDHCSAPHCISHEKFAMNLVEQIICSSCGANSEPLPFTQMVHYVPTPALCQQSKKYNHNFTSFGQLLKSGEALGNIRDCPSGCGAKIQIKKTLLNQPDIVSIGLVWDSERPSINQITDVFRLIGTSLNLVDVFDSLRVFKTGEQSVEGTELQLVGLVTYYGKHYSTFFYHTKLCSWIYFDDAAVREIGPHWEQVAEKCIKGHFQPLLLLYANPNGTIINASTAPKVVTMVSNTNKCDKSFPYKPNGLKNNLTLSKHAFNSNGLIRRPFSLSVAPIKPICLPGQSQTQAQVRCLKKNLNSHRPGSMDDLLNHYNSASEDVIDSVPDSPLTRSSISSNYFSDIGEVDSGYISRKTVENILNLQKMNNTIKGQRSSLSSVDSYSELPIKKSVSVVQDSKLLLQAKACSLQRRDSGNSSNGSGGGDRLSASSGSSTSSSSKEENPYFNFIPATKKLSSNQTSNRQINCSNKDRNGQSVIDQGYDSFSLSSSDSYPSNGGPSTPSKLNQIATQSRLSQIPEDHQLMELLNATNIHDYDKLCSESDLLMLKSHEKEREGDLRTAAVLSDSAAHKARSAMDAPYSNPQVLMSAKMKHSMCVMRSASLHKRLKEIETEEKRRLKLEAAELGNHSRQGSRDSSQGRHSRQHSKDGSVKEIKTKESKSSKKINNESSSGKTIQLYATLPKKLNKKKIMMINSPQLSSFRAEVEVDNRNSVPLNLETFKSQSSLRKLDKLRDIKSDVESVSSFGSSKKISNKHNSVNHHHVKDSDLSDYYYSEWEGIKGAKKSIYRSLSGSSSIKSTSNNSTSSYNEESGKKVITGQSNKKHKIRRKLLIGSFMKRKNRSLPDLRENGAKDDKKDKTVTKTSDDYIVPQTITQVNRKPFHQVLGIYQKPSLIKVSPSKNHETSIMKVETQTVNPTSFLRPNTTSSTSAVHEVNNKMEYFTHLTQRAPTPPKPKVDDNVTLNGKSSRPLPPSPSPPPEISSTSGNNNHIVTSRPYSPSQGIEPNEELPPPPESFLEELREKRKEMSSTSLLGQLTSEKLASYDTVDSEMIKKDKDIQRVNKDGSASLSSEVKSNVSSIVRDLSSRFEVIATTNKTGNGNATITPNVSNSLSDTSLVNKSNRKYCQVQSSANGGLNNGLAVNGNQTFGKHQRTASICSYSASESATRPSMPNLSSSLSSSSASSPSVSTSSTSLRQGLRVVALLGTSMKNNNNNNNNNNSDVSNSNGQSVFSNLITPIPNSAGSCNRPDRPPDYETAMKRLGLMKAEMNNKLNSIRYRPPSPSLPSSLPTSNNQSNNHVLNSSSSTMQSTATATSVVSSNNCDEITVAIKKRDTPKKSVSFSDQVVLVAPAEDEEEEYLPNPLLERILGKKTL